MSRVLTSSCTVENVVQWVYSFADLAHLASHFKNAAMTGQDLLQMDSDASLEAGGIEDGVERARLLWLIRRARRSEARVPPPAAQTEHEISTGGSSEKLLKQQSIEMITQRTVD